LDHLKKLSKFAPALKTALMRRISGLSFNQQYYAQNLVRIGLGVNRKYAAIELSYNKHSPASIHQPGSVVLRHLGED
jgi:hypothetical protein